MAWSEAFTEIFKFVNSFWEGRSTVKQVTNVISIYDCMNDVIRNTDVEMIMIFAAHNCGGDIKAVERLRISCLYEDFQKPFRSEKLKYQEIDVDETYARMLGTLLMDKKIAHATETMPDCMLKDIYKSVGVSYSDVFLLKNTKKKIYYASFRTSKSVNTINDPEQRAVIENNIRQIRKIFR
jgi:hypothetical protein